MSRITSWILGCVALSTLPAAANAQVQSGLAQSSQSDIALGKRAFEVNCARCHGIGGTGDTGPSLAQPLLPRARTDSAMQAIIEDGIAGTEMPSSFWLSDADVTRVIAYVRSLGAAPPAPLRGNAANGASTFAHAGCGACHIVNGTGGAVGPELTAIGDRRSPAYLKRALIDPAADFPMNANRRMYAVVTAVPRAGAPVTGMRVNEDTYTIQVRDMSGHLYSFRKAALRELRRENAASLMPSARGVLSDAEVDNVVAYLAGLRAGAKP